MRRRLQWKGEPEYRAAAGRAHHVQAPPQDLRQPGRQRQSQPRAHAGLRVEPLERLEDPFRKVRGNPGTAVTSPSSFGIITGPLNRGYGTGTARQMQFMFRFNF